MKIRVRIACLDTGERITAGMFTGADSVLKPDPICAK